MPPIDQPEKDFAALLKQYREAARMTQQALGDLIHVDGTYIGRWENRQRYPVSHYADRQSQYEQYVNELASILTEKAGLTRDEQQIFLEAWKRCGQQWLEEHPRLKEHPREHPHDRKKGIGEAIAALEEPVGVPGQRTELQGRALDNETKDIVTQHPPEPEEAPELPQAVPVQSQPSRKFVGTRLAVAIAIVALALVVAPMIMLLRQSVYATCSTVHVASGQDITSTLANDLGSGGCWQLPAGTFYLHSSIKIAPGNTLQGQEKDETVLMAQDWGDGSMPMLTIEGGKCSGTAPCRRVTNLTLNGNNRVATVILANGMLVQNANVTGGLCSGIEINGSDADIEGSFVQRNGHVGQASMGAKCLGAGIYMTISDADLNNNCHQTIYPDLIAGCAYSNVKINNNDILFNGGFGVEANVFSGNESRSDPGDYVQFTHNTVTDNDSDGLWLYASSYWNIQENSITTRKWTRPMVHKGHIACDGTPANGSGSAAINICADDQPVCSSEGSSCQGPFEANDNLVGDTGFNQIARNYYGIVLLGVLQGVSYSDGQKTYTAQSTHYPSGSRVGTLNICFGSQVGVGYYPNQIGPSNRLPRNC